MNLINQKVMQKHSCSLCPAANLCICLQHCSVVSKYPQSLQTKSKIDNIVSSFISNYKCSKLPNSQSMFWRSKFILGMPKLFGHSSKVKLSSEKTSPKTLNIQKIKLDFQNINSDFKSFGHYCS